MKFIVDYSRTGSNEWGRYDTIKEFDTMEKALGYIWDLLLMDQIEMNLGVWEYKISVEEGEE